MRTIKLLVAAAATLAMHGVAAAQYLPPEQGAWSGPMPGFGWMSYAGPGPGPAMMRSGSGGSGQSTCNAAAGRIDDRLAAIKAELKVTHDQEPLWNAYAAAAHDSANAALARCTALASQRASVSLPDRLNQNEQLLAAQLNALRAMAAALKPLYAALSDSQKRSADHLSWSPMGAM